MSRIMQSVVLSTAIATQSIAADEYVKHVGFVPDVIRERYTDVYANHDAAAYATTGSSLQI